MARSATFRDVDKGWTKLLGTLKLLRGRDSYVKVGVVGPAAEQSHADDGLTNVELAAVHEFGSSDGRVPERSFIRSTYAQNREAYVELFKKFAGAVVDRKMDIERALNLLGLRAASDIKKRVLSGTGIPPPLAESTIERKGSSRPLVDTGRLIQSVTHAVVLRGEGE